MTPPQTSLHASSQHSSGEHLAAGLRYAHALGVEVEFDHILTTYDLCRRASQSTSDPRQWSARLLTEATIGIARSVEPVEIIGTPRNPHTPECITPEALAERQWGRAVNERHEVLAGILLGDPPCECVETLTAIPDTAAWVALVRTHEPVCDAWWSYLRNDTLAGGAAVRWMVCWQQSHPALAGTPWNHWGSELASVLCAAHSEAEALVQVMGRVQPAALEEDRQVLVHVRPTSREKIALALATEPAYRRLGYYHLIPERQARAAFGAGDIALLPEGLDAQMLSLALELYEAELGGLEGGPSLQRAVDTASQAIHLVPS